ncbi:ATP-binding protein [Dactylosporangium darangshiense]|uniref:ATP-binding protein n=1 Tax=Dactylosporangium darangshiense TaxID=579108 RepID=A0ABP8CX41_9ACTN
MSTSLGDVLETARRQRFVGRREELAGFDAAVGGHSTRRVLFVHGQGGIGKTTLLAELGGRARAAGRTVIQVDGRDVDPSPDGLRTAIQDAAGRQTDAAPLGPLLAGGVLLVDGYEQLTPIDGWLREQLIPSLSADTVVVLAGREPPTVPWRSDAGWRELVTVYRLDHFDPDESGQLLAHAGVEPSVRPHLVALGAGHPLTLALLADAAARGQVPDTLADAPDLISTLLQSFLGGVPTQAQLTGLATCAIAWVTTEDLLAHMVGADAPAVWQWLAGRPFVTCGPRGLSVHDLARDVLNAEFQRRVPEQYRTYDRRIFDHAVAGLRTATGLHREPGAHQLLFTHRRGPFSAVISALRARGSAAVVPAHPDEHDQVCATIERFEGPASAELARAWLSEQPERLYVVRTGERVAGFAHHLLCPSGSALEDRDPVVRAVLNHVAQEGPVRPGERVFINRFASGVREHQRDPYMMAAGPVSSVIEWFARPLAWSFVVVVDAEFWAPKFDYLAFAPLVRIDVGGLRHVAFGIDWRRLPLGPWLDLMYERGHAGGSGPAPAALLRPPALDRHRFEAAVRAALQTLHRPDLLAGNPLLGSALAATSGGPDAAQLRATIEDAVAQLGNLPKGPQLQAVLHRTYLRPAATQEAAAEVLDLPLSTYRRYLARAIEHLTDILWAVEIGEVRPTPVQPA